MLQEAFKNAEELINEEERTKKKMEKRRAKKKVSFLKSMLCLISLIFCYCYSYRDFSLINDFQQIYFREIEKNGNKEKKSIKQGGMTTQ